MKSDIDEELIVELYTNQNMSVKDIANKIGSSPSTVQRRLKKLGVLRPGHKKTKVDIELLERLYIDENKTIREISDELGICYATIAQHLDCAGIEKDKDAIRETYEKTMLDRYGATVPMLSDELRSKIEETNMAKYGTKTPLENADIHGRTISSQNEERYRKCQANLSKKGCNFNIPPDDDELSLSSETIRDSADDDNASRETESECFRGFISILTKEFLIRHYIEENMRRKEIADMLGCSVDTVKKALKQHKVIKDRKQVQRLIEDTNYKKNGVKTNLSTPEFKEQSRKTCLEKYGVEHSAQALETIDKRKKTCLEKYGVDNPSKTPEVKKKISDIHSNPLLYEANNAKRRAFYTEKYGAGVTHQSLIHVEHIDEWNDFADWSQRAFERNNNQRLDKHVVKDYFNVTLGTLNGKIRSHGVSELFILSESSIEYEWASWLEENNIAFVMHDRNVIKPKEIDFLLLDHHIGIEINPAPSHNSDICVYAPKAGVCKERLYHYDKSRSAAEKGIYIVHVFDWSDVDKLKQHILSLCSDSYANINECNYEITDDSIVITDVMTGITLFTLTYCLRNDEVVVLDFATCFGYDGERLFNLALNKLLARYEHYEYLVFTLDRNMGKFKEFGSIIGHSEVIAECEPEYVYCDVTRATNHFFTSEQENELPSEHYKRVYDAGKTNYRISLQSVKDMLRQYDF